MAARGWALTRRLLSNYAFCFVRERDGTMELQRTTRQTFSRKSRPGAVYLSPGAIYHPTGMTLAIGCSFGERTPEGRLSARWQTLATHATVFDMSALGYSN